MTTPTNTTRGTWSYFVAFRDGSSSGARGDSVITTASPVTSAEGLTAIREYIADNTHIPVSNVVFTSVSLLHVEPAVDTAPHTTNAA